MTISFFNVYFSGLILVAVRIGWIMYSRLDVYDWHYYKLEIWIKYIFYQIFWPFLLLNPKRLISGKGYFKHEFAGINIDLAEQDRELDRLWSNPPPCSDILQYSASNYMYSDTSEAMFYFSAQDIERVLKRSVTPLLELMMMRRSSNGCASTIAMSPFQCHHLFGVNGLIMSLKH
jgi:hypothetical protein